MFTITLAFLGADTVVYGKSIWCSCCLWQAVFATPENNDLVLRECVIGNQIKFSACRVAESVTCHRIVKLGFTGMVAVWQSVLALFVGVGFGLGLESNAGFGLELGVESF